MSSIKAVFGPVPSRRLGQSLGVDPIPSKTCNWNCVYCQLGHTARLTSERRVVVDEALILDQVHAALARHPDGGIDWITFVGSGEPTLHAGLGRLIAGVKAMTDIPVAVITNGSLLYQPQVRAELLSADAVLPSLDAGSERLYRRIDRPLASLDLARHIDGIVAFRDEYAGRLMLEIMLMDGVNDDERSLRELAAAVARIRPDAIHLDVPSRPPAESWVRPASQEGLLRASAILGGQVVLPIEGTFELGGYDDVIDAIIGVITRHPMREEQLARALKRWSVDEVERALASLEVDGRARVVERLGVRFWSIAEARYVERERHGI